MILRITGNIAKQRISIKPIYAFLANKKFACRVLNGDSLSNLTIHCDLTVSCNCNDRFGFGRMGSLENQGLREIFFGERANYFRKKIASGKFPIVNCSQCSDLIFIDKKNVKKSIDYSKFPEALMIENTANCNLSCLWCDRERIFSLRKKRFISLEEIKKISVELKTNKIKLIHYFAEGEPFLSDNIRDELEIIKKDNPEIRIVTSTNGTLINMQDKIEAALLLNRIVFSIDGSNQDSYQKYRKGGSFYQAYNNMKNLVVLRNRLKKTEPKIIWKYILFKWNDSKKNIEEAIMLAKDAQVDEIFFEKTLRPPYGISYKSYLGIGYINKISKFDGRIARIKL